MERRRRMQKGIRWMKQQSNNDGKKVIILFSIDNKLFIKFYTSYKVSKKLYSSYFFSQIKCYFLSFSFIFVIFVVIFAVVVFFVALLIRHSLSLTFCFFFTTLFNFCQCIKNE